ncbi:MAG: hypothetical protein ABIP79_16715 [Chitinophagaceae bacterium]
MDLALNDSMTYSAMHKALSEKLPAYKIELKKNPIARFEYIQVYKSAYVGTWVRVFEKKNKVMLIKTIPSTMARALLGGLIAALIASSAQNKLRNEVAQVLKDEFATSEV